MLLNEDIEKSGGICFLTFVVDKCSGFYLHLSIFSTTQLRSAYIINGILSDFWYCLNFNYNTDNFFAGR